MALTHKKMAESKKKKFYVKEDNPDAKYYSKAEAVEQNRKLRADRMKVEQFEADLKAKREEKEIKKEKEVDPIGGSTTPEAPPSPLSPAEKTKVEELQKKLSAEKGPGSKARKEKIQAQIDDILE